MKRNIFILLLTSLVILVLLYFYDKREVVLNKEIRRDNVYIEYPYFNKSNIDNYIGKYLNNYTSDIFDYLFIDYDYIDNDDYIDLTLYVYEEVGNISREVFKYLKVDIEGNSYTSNNSNNSSNRVREVDNTYDVLNFGYIDSNSKMVALTFDDGPNHNTSRVLDILEEYGVRATFFVLGCNIKGNEKIIKRMNDLGMEIGNHTFSHKLLTSYKSSKIVEEIDKTDCGVYSIIGKYPTVVRPSYGSYNKRIRNLIDRPIITWNIDTLDWKYHSSSNIYKRVMEDISDGDIVLMHDIYSATANSLELIIPKLLNDGYKLVTVSELFYYKNMDVVGGEVYSRGK